MAIESKVESRVRVLRIFLQEFFFKKSTKNNLRASDNGNGNLPIKIVKFKFLMHPRISLEDLFPSTSKNW